MIHQCVNVMLMHEGLQKLSEQGIVPGEIHVHERTAMMMTNGLVGVGKLDPRLLNTRLKRFVGIPVIPNPIVPIHGMVIRPIHLMNDPNWMLTMDAERRAKENTAEPTAESSTSAEPTEDINVVHSSQFLSPEAKTVTDILLEAATGCDDVRCAAVILIRGEKNVSMKTNLPTFELVGVLQGLLARITYGQ